MKVHIAYDVDTPDLLDNLMSSVLKRRLERAEDEVQRLRTERDLINGERMTLLIQRDQLRAQIADALEAQSDDS